MAKNLRDLSSLIPAEPECMWSIYLQGGNLIYAPHNPGGKRLLDIPGNHTLTHIKSLSGVALQGTPLEKLVRIKPVVDDDSSLILSLPDADISTGVAKQVVANLNAQLMYRTRVDTSNNEIAGFH